MTTTTPTPQLRWRPGRGVPTLPAAQALAPWLSAEAQELRRNYDELHGRWLGAQRELAALPDEGAAIRADQAAAADAVRRGVKIPAPSSDKIAARRAELTRVNAAHQAVAAEALRDYAVAVLTERDAALGRLREHLEGDLAAELEQLRVQTLNALDRIGNDLAIAGWLHHLDHDPKVRGADLGREIEAAFDTTATRAAELLAQVATPRVEPEPTFGDIAEAAGGIGTPAGDAAVRAHAEQLRRHRTTTLTTPR